MSNQAPLLTEEHVPWGPSEEVPPWSLDHDTVLRVERVPSNQLVLHRHASGHDGFPVPPPWLLPFLQLGAVKLLLLEHRVRRVILVPICPILADKSSLPVPGIASPTFLTWFAYNILVSGVAHLDVITNGVFVARAVVSDLSPDSRSFLLWRTMMEHSVAGSLGAVPLSAFAVLGWLVMGAQLANVVLRTFPITGKSTAGHKLEYVYGENCEYLTPLQATSQHEHALPVLLDCTRMVSLTALWYEAYTHESWSKVWTRTRIPADWGSLLQTTLAKLLFFSLLESAYQLNLQVAGLGLQKAVSPTHSVDSITLLSLATSFLMGFKTWSKEYRKASDLAAGISKIDIDAELKETNALWEGFVQACRDGTAAEELERREAGWTGLKNPKFLVQFSSAVEKGLASQRMVGYVFRGFQAVSLLYLGLLIRALFQTCAVILCPTGLHNIGVGCLDLP